MAKTYTVVKNGEALKELKTLPAAKKLADTEGAEVWCDGAVVYAPTANDAEPTVPAQERVLQYTLTAKMNIRKAPAMDAPKLGIAEAGTVVDVTAIENDWLCLTDGTFILYGGGKFAEHAR